MEYYCTIRYYTLLAFQRHKVCNFWIYGLKDMIFASLQIFEIYLNLFGLSKATWQLLISPYRFGLITNTGRQIL
jgi:hypothetical protein